MFKIIIILDYFILVQHSREGLNGMVAFTVVG